MDSVEPTESSAFPIMSDQPVALILGVRNQRSIAYAVANKLHALGYRLAISYMQDTQEDVEFIVESQQWENVLLGEVDVRNEDQIKDFLAQIDDKWGKISYVLHSVAYGSHKVLCSKNLLTNEEAPDFIDIPFDDLVEAIDISAYSMLRIARCSIPHLTPNASLLTCTYLASQRVIPKYGGMGMVKACLENIVKYLAHYMGQQGHRVNALSPGLVMTTSAASISGIRTMRKMSSEISPLGNIKLDHIAESAAYYLSDASHGVNGNIHFIDGGINVMGGV